MTSGIYNIRVANLRKATLVRQQGFETSIHALPTKVRSRLDWYLNCRMSSVNCLRKLCAEFPGISLPSYKAVQNYRKRYHYIPFRYRQRPFQ